MFGKSHEWVAALIALTEAEKIIVRNSSALEFGVWHINQVRAGIKDKEYQILVMEKEIIRNSIQYGIGAAQRAKD